jgi:hypothetical protein
LQFWVFSLFAGRKERIAIDVDDGPGEGPDGQRWVVHTWKSQ